MKRTSSVALCALPLLMGTLLVCATAQAAPPVHTVKGGATFFLETGVPVGGNLILHYSFNASLNQDGSASGFITSTINAITLPAAGGHPDPFGTGDPVRYEVVDLTVTGNEAFIVAVVVFSPDFPQEVGTVHCFDVLDVGGPPNSGDLVSIDGFGPLVTIAGSISVR